MLNPAEIVRSEEGRPENERRGKKHDVSNPRAEEGQEPRDEDTPDPDPKKEDSDNQHEDGEDARFAPVEEPDKHLEERDDHVAQGVSNGEVLRVCNRVGLHEVDARDVSILREHLLPKGSQRHAGRPSRSPATAITSSPGCTYSSRRGGGPIDSSSDTLDDEGVQLFFVLRTEVRGVRVDREEGVVHATSKAVCGVFNAGREKRLEACRVREVDRPVGQDASLPDVTAHDQHRRTQEPHVVDADLPRAGARGDVDLEAVHAALVQSDHLEGVGQDRRVSRHLVHHEDAEQDDAGQQQREAVVHLVRPGQRPRQRNDRRVRRNIAPTHSGDRGRRNKQAGREDGAREEEEEGSRARRRLQGKEEETQDDHSASGTEKEKEEYDNGRGRRRRKLCSRKTEEEKTGGEESEIGPGKKKFLSTSSRCWIS